MKIVAIDLGSYSLKILEGKFERKMLRYEHLSEILIPFDLFDNEAGLLEFQTRKIGQWLSEIDYQGKLLLQLPAPYITTRFLTLPTSGRKKAELMVPFQLEEDVPFRPGQYHYAISLHQQEKQFECLAVITDRSRFQHFFDKCNEFTAPPQVITADISSIENYAHLMKLDGPVCFLDLGHRLSKAYYLKNMRVVDYHTSPIAGEYLNQVIAQTYQQSMEQTVEYKHQSAFVLLDSLFDQVDEDQREFAKLMKQSLAPLMSDLKRWNLGYLVGHGQKIEKTLLLGGTSLIKNMPHYIEFHTDSQVELFQPVQGEELKAITTEPQLPFLSSLAHLQALNFSKRKPLVNMASGEFASTSFEEMPLHSAAFIGARVAMVLSIFCLGLLIESFFLNSQSKYLSQKVSALFQSSELGINRSLTSARYLQLRPEGLLRQVETQYRELSTQIEEIKKIGQLDALKDLYLLSQNVPSSQDYYLSRFQTDAREALALFRGNGQLSMKGKLPIFEKISLPQKELQLVKGDTELELRFEGQSL